MLVGTTHPRLAGTSQLCRVCCAELRCCGFESKGSAQRTLQNLAGCDCGWGQATGFGSRAEWVGGPTRLARRESPKRAIRSARRVGPCGIRVVAQDDGEENTSRIRGRTSPRFVRLQVTRIALTLDRARNIRLPWIDCRARSVNQASLSGIGSRTASPRFCRVFRWFFRECRTSFRASKNKWVHGPIHVIEMAWLCRGREKNFLNKAAF